MVMVAMVTQRLRNVPFQFVRKMNFTGHCTSQSSDVDSVVGNVVPWLTKLWLKGPPERARMTGASEDWDSDEEFQWRALHNQMRYLPLNSDNKIVRIPNGDKEHPHCRWAYSLQAVGTNPIQNPW